MECAFLLILKCVLRIIYFICDMFLKQCHRVGVVLCGCLIHFFLAYFLEEACLHKYLETSLLAVFLSGVLLRQNVFSASRVLSVFYSLPAISDCCFIMAFSTKLSPQQASCRDDRRQIFLNIETVESIFKYDHCLLKRK